ncbi:glyoxylase-like metal-dependent hydrolase (beta-lactamase superfamily II) [Streptosporangium becharense]|uniref:Glyoxylase-like metal-dependent hydrolase (Beta-lactamase superfamily II) n=1 Tax=Streptosporangium becharense TaxID=1816182 RepID=A0A7W9IF45_9ACTN|nr:glyoxylase-like metal-dependent hydrolase (beta-lactamase superfamily II) [Streptosporangium becharense]MBB5819171.1 glyoxylase-like metal-dependent hydrolase (beta-lactamase superfamily II) [Streptosporangium becharense]
MEDGRWIEVADRVLVRRYAELDLSVGLVLGDGGCLVVDTRGDERQGAELAEQVRRVTSDPWTVVITHSHFDHSFGTRAFLECPVWAHEDCRADLAANGERMRQEWMLHYRREGRPDIAADIAATGIAPPGRLVTDRAELTVGGRPVTLAHLGRGHSANDLVVHLPDSGVLFAGDLVENGAPPAYEDAYPLEWPTTVTGLLGYPCDVVVPGHGDPVDRAFVTAQHAEITAVAHLCAEVAARRTTPDEAVRLSPYPEETTRTALGRPVTTG